MKPHQQQRYERNCCIDCGLPTAFYVACLPCRRRRNDRRSERNFDRWVEREERLEQKYRLVDTRTAAVMCNVSTRTIRAYIQTGRLTVQRREMRRAWLKREDVEKCRNTPASIR